MKKFLLIGLLSISMLSLAACGKDKEPEETKDDGNYAINEVRDTVEEEEEETEAELVPVAPVVEETTETTEPEKYVAPDEIYNVAEDQYAADVRSLDTISIDSNLIGFPCSYSYVAERFDLYTRQYIGGGLEKTVPIDDTLEDYTFEVEAIPKSGEGVIKFTFTSSNKTTITNMQCTKVTLLGGNTEGNTVMSLALPQFITFGSSYQDILDVFGIDNITHDESTKSGSEYRVRYLFEDQHILMEMTGHDGGLYIVTLTYNYTEDN